MHPERFAAFRALQTRLADARELAAVIVDRDGFPMLHVVRVDGARSLPVGCVYVDGGWFFSTPDVLRWVPTSDAAAAAAEIRRVLA